MMEICKDIFYKNQTRRFILPVVKDYGEELVKKLNSITKLSIGISDTVLPKSLNNHIFILVDTNASKDLFISILGWIKEQSFYETDYVFDDLQTGYQHMLVIKIPSMHKNMINSLLNSKYSKLYFPNNIKNYFKTNDLRFKILTKDVQQAKKFVGWINETFDTHYDYKLWEFEVEKPIKISNECFNYDLKNK